MSKLPARIPNTKKKKIGRPSSFNWEIATELLELIEQDKSLIAICRLPHMPPYGTVMRWLSVSNDDPDLSSFRDKYRLSRAVAPHTTYSRIQELELDLIYGKIDWKSFQSVVASMQWRAGKMNPKVYGEKLHHVGADGGPIRVAHSLEQAILSRDKHAQRLSNQPGETIDVEIDAETPEPQKAQKP